MHIGIFITSLVGGGAERTVLTLAEALVARGCAVSLYLLTNRMDYAPHESIRVYSLSDRRKVPSMFSSAFYGAAVTRFRQLQQDIEAEHGVHDAYLFNLPEDYVLGDRLALTPSYYVVHTAVEHALAEQTARGRLRGRRLKRRFSCLQGKHVIAVSKGVEDEIRRMDWMSVASSRTIYNPFDIDRIIGLSAENAEVPAGDYIVHIGRAARVKRHDVLFRAINALPRDLKLVLLSKDREKLLKLSRTHGVEDRVLIPGFQENPYAWIRCAKLLVLCSDYEGFGNVLVEAIACGTPVVSTDCPYGPAEILTGAHSRWLVPTDDPDALARVMKEALLCDDDIVPAEIIDKVRIDTVTDEYIELFESGADER